MHVGVLSAAEPAEPGLFRSPSNARLLPRNKSAQSSRNLATSPTRTNTMRGGNDSLNWGKSQRNRLRGASQPIRQVAGETSTSIIPRGVPMLLTSPRIAHQPPASLPPVTPPPATGTLNDSEFQISPGNPPNPLGVQPSDRTTDPFTDDTFPPSQPAPGTAPGMQSILPQDTRPGGEFQPLPNTNTTPPATPPDGQPLNQPGNDNPRDPAFSLDPVPTTPPSNLELPEPKTTPSLPNALDELKEKEDPSDCKEIYNGKDCCKEADGCKKAHNLLDGASISNITLDITPKFTPDKTSFLLPGDRANTSEIARAREFEELESRNWKDRNGVVVAFGRFTNFVNGRVIVESTSGEKLRLPYRALSDDDICYVSAWWQIPGECKHVDESYAGRHWLASTMTWKASALCHKPLYFEDVQLERYGHTAGAIKQPILSGAHFFGSIVTLPYKMGIHPPRECQYALGYYRPGSCAPWMIPPVPISLRGALAEAAVLIGGVYVIP